MKPSAPSRPVRQTVWLALAAFTSFCPLAHGAPSRTFTNSAGKKLTASFEGMAGTKAKLRRSDGKIFEIDPATLSSADQAFLKKAATSAGDDAKKLNQAAGHEFSDGSSFAARKADELASALGLRPESQSKYSRSWRLYAAFAKGYRLFDAMPYSVALYSGADGLVNNLSIVYANKGDFGSTAGLGEDHFAGGTTSTAASLAEAMDRDEKAVAAALTKVLGEPRKQRFGDSGTRRSILRWDWNGHAFLLANEEDEYVGLSIVSSEYADAGGRSSLVKDSDIKQRLLASIVKSDNGDVLLTEIPMVDQGPKGYCVPATFERAMRTMGLEADMYLLAMVGQSKAGGGTSVERLLENVRSQVYRKGRRTKDDDHKQLRMRDLKRYIDQGIPVMWTLHSVDEYNETANSLTAKRKSVVDWNAHAAEVAETAATFADKAEPLEHNHICMIIGYNENTGEIAVTDSWGARFELRWVPLATASWASMGSTFMILP